MREPDLDPEKPLLAARTRLQKVQRPSKVDSSLVIGMNAAGVSRGKIAEILDVAPQTVEKTLLNTPGAKDRIREIREALKLTKMQEANRLETRVWKRLEKELDKGSAKDVDAMARAAHALEKIQSAASGEGQRVDISGLNQTPNIDLKVLIAQLLE